VLKAVTAAAGLPSATACRDEALLATLLPPPPDDREAIRAVRADVVHAGNLQLAGRYAKGLELARGALGRAEALAWPPLVATARLRLGTLLGQSGALEPAQTELEQAFFEATRGAVPEVALEAAARLVYVVGVTSARYVEGRRWARFAEVALADVPDGERLRRASLLVNLAMIQAETGARDEARVLLEQALTIREAALGPEHPDVANSLGNLAIVHYATGDYDEARALLERALSIQEDVLGPEHPVVADTLNNLANVHEITGEHDEARVLHERALAISQRTLGPEHPDVARSLDNLANVHAATGNHQRAERLHEQALAMRERVLGPDHPEVANSLNNLASVAEDTGDHLRAKLLFERALSIWEKTLGPDHPELAYSLLGLARVALSQHRPQDAMPVAERAVRLREHDGMGAELLAEARFVLAEALWDLPAAAGGDPVRARALAEHARDVLRATSSGDVAGLAEVDAWLVDHGGAP
jgi:tetratricopeptide (TPR) repeat protein